MKTRVILSAMVVSLVLTANAGTSTARGRIAKVTPVCENTSDKELKLENWMVDESFWSTTGSSYFQRDFDEPLAMESWMTSIEEWECNLFVPVEKEAQLVLDPWMMNVTAWDAITCSPAENENPLTVETWMTDNSFWEENTHFAESVEF